MKEIYRPVLKAHVLTDDANRVRAIRHTGEYWESPAGGGLVTAATYLRDFASVYEIPTGKLDRLETKVSFLTPHEQGEEYRLSEERRQFDSETFGFYQTHLNVPVRRAGLKVTVKQGPNRVIASEDTSQPGVDARLPSTEAIERYRRLFAAANAVTLQHRAVLADTDLQAIPPVDGTGETAAEREGEAYVRKLFAVADGPVNQRVGSRLIRGRFWIYRYDAAERLQEPLPPDPPVLGTVPRS